MNIPTSDAWTKVQDGEVTQWSVVTSRNPTTRLDLVSYIDTNGARTSYYLVRSACATGSVAKYVIKPGNKMGLGVDCNGNVMSGSSAPIELAPKLPPSAAVLLKP